MTTLSSLNGHAIYLNRIVSTNKMIINTISQNIFIFQMNILMKVLLLFFISLFIY